MSWTSKRVLVTGAGGFIGSHLTERLVQLGARTKAFVHYRADGTWGWLDHSPHKNDIEVIAGDLGDRDSVKHAVRNTDIVFHLGALIAIPYSYQAPLSFLRTNVEGTLNVLQAARACDVEAVVHTSTSEVYGTALRVPIDESHPLQAQSPYAASKIGADKVAEALSLSFALPIVTLRPFNTFGPRQSARAVLPTIVSQCIAGRKVRMGNLHPTRDLNFVSDTVEAFVRAATVESARGMTINVGSGREISVGELVKLVVKALGISVEIVTEERRIRPPGSEVERLVADNKVAREILGWKPQVSLEDGLAITIDWLKKHRDCYRPDLYAV